MDFLQGISYSKVKCLMFHVFKQKRSKRARSFVGLIHTNPHKFKHVLFFLFASVVWPSVHGMHKAYLKRPRNDLAWTFFKPSKRRNSQVIFVIVTVPFPSLKSFIQNCGETGTCEVFSVNTPTHI